MHQTWQRFERCAAVLLTAFFLSLMACSSINPFHASSDEIEAWAAHRKEVVKEDDEDGEGSGGLVVRATDVVTDGRFAKIRGRVTNKYKEPVEGVRYVVVIVAERGGEMRPLDSFQYEVDTRIEPGQERMMRIDLESMYLGTIGGARLLVAASPVNVGGREVPPPEGWKQ
jgi:hypothetical protein